MVKNYFSNPVPWEQKSGKEIKISSSILEMFHSYVHVSFLHKNVSISLTSFAICVSEIGCAYTSSLSTFMVNLFSLIFATAPPCFSNIAQQSSSTLIMLSQNGTKLRKNHGQG